MNLAIMLIQKNQQWMLGLVLVFASGLHQTSHFLLPFNYHSCTCMMNLSISVFGKTPTWLQKGRPFLQINILYTAKRANLLLASFSCCQYNGLNVIFPFSQRIEVKQILLYKYPNWELKIIFDRRGEALA